ncbi:MAG: D-glycero-beta-D-manno-heptose 1,7-bisphosphate 7-phosphatase [Lachnospiraceae bacterium]|nr:D-glycero-beta-D-manno-heptose 1,7-bisphosphate 7-phosphatase [Lachnospiraceae bacterium]
MKTVIMAGGMGKRLGSLFSDIPKPLVEIEGIPVLEREIICLRDQGFKDIILTVCHKGEMIKDHFKDGKSLSVNIDYYFEEEPLGNAGALFKIYDRLSEDFLLLNADSLFDVDFNRFLEYHRKKQGKATIFVHPNSHPYDSGLIMEDEDGSVQKWLSKEDERPKYYRNLVNAGLHVLSKEVLKDCGIDPSRIGKQDENGNVYKADLDRDILKPLAGTHLLYAYESSEYVKDMGTPERYAQVCEDVKNGIAAAKNLKNKQKAVFLDRDDTIIKDVGFLRDIEKLTLLPKAASAIKRINELGYLVIVVTNQPVIARGELTVEGLSEIHKKLETLLGEEGAYLDGIYYCPHHPDSGYEGEIKELKIACDCRKPKPGMLLKAAKEHNIDLKASIMVGDKEKDVMAGKAAGTKTVLISKNSRDEDWTDSGQDMTVKDLAEFADRISELLGEKQNG